jgi:hypothetical protein
MTLLKMLRFILLHHALWPGLVLCPNERQGLWLPKVDLQDSPSWSSSPLLLLRDIHSKLLSDYRCKEGCAPSQSQVNVGASGGLSSQDGVSQQQEADPLSIPQLNRHRVTQQILSHWQPFRDLELMFAGSRCAKQFSLRSQQRMVATVEDSVLAWSISLWQTFFAMTMGALIPVIPEKPLVPARCSWQSSLYRPLGSQKSSRLGG